MVPLAGTVATLLILLQVWFWTRKLARLHHRELREMECALHELKVREARTHHLAYHDALTGLPNRALFDDNANRALMRARQGDPVAILLLDLDRFRTVNDRFGHLAGDALIEEVARRLAQAVDVDRAVARLGGDRFAILLGSEDLAEGLEGTLDRIRGELRRPFDIFGGATRIGASIGIVLAPEFGSDRLDLMRKADIALNRAKDEGRDCHRFFTESMDEALQLRTVLEADLRDALATGRGLGVHYQPLVDSGRRKVTGLEALLRWHHPQRGWIPPQLFVPVAEESGLISLVGEWVLGEACKVAREWPKLTIAVNLSPVQFGDERFAERICDIVRAAGISPDRIELEVTESVVLDRDEIVRGARRRLRAEGFRIALDFGTGYSSLGTLSDFEVDKIKIDRSFVHSLGQSADAGAIVTAVIRLGHAMGLPVAAEGVETAYQERFLRSAGCSQLQGFLFSRAVPAHRLHGSLSAYGQEGEKAA